MSSVTGRINSIQQPRGGYIQLSQFDTTVYNDGAVLSEAENVHANIVGLTVDYFIRAILVTDEFEAFKMSLWGAEKAEQAGQKGSVRAAQKLLDGIQDLDDASIINACKLVTFDVWYRSPMLAASAANHHDTNPNKETVSNIQTLIQRSLTFFGEYGPILQDGFTFEPKKKNIKAYQKMIQSGKGSYGGYTATVSSGDGDFLTADTLWDLKVSKSKPRIQNTLQLLMYWIMGKHSGQDIYTNITKLGIFNPRLNTAYLLDVNNISDETVKAVEQDVICYP